MLGKSSNIKFTCAHDSYLINLCSADKTISNKSYESFLDDARLVPAVMGLFFPDKIKITEPLSPPGEIIPELRRAQKLALQENDLSEAYLIMRTIAQSLPLDYIVQLNQLKSAFPNCAPKPYSDLLTLNIGDRVGTFLINDEGRYEKKLKGDERFRKFLITYLGFDDVLKPSAGYIRLASPEPLDYVAGFLDRFFAFQTLVSPSEITIRSEDPWKYFRGNLSRVCNTKREKLA